MHLPPSVAPLPASRRGMPTVAPEPRWTVPAARWTLAQGAPRRRRRRPPRAQPRSGADQHLGRGTRRTARSGRPPRRPQPHARELNPRSPSGSRHLMPWRARMGDRPGRGCMETPVTLVQFCARPPHGPAMSGRAPNTSKEESPARPPRRCRERSVPGPAECHPTCSALTRSPRARSWQLAQGPRRSAKRRGPRKRSLPLKSAARVARQR